MKSMINTVIIEDDPMVREINCKFLSKIEGFNLIIATGSVSEAKAIIIEMPPQLILLDVFLPQGNGLELLKWLRKEEIKSDVILITAEKGIEAVQEAFRYGAVDYLIKPFTFERFKEALIQFRNRKESFNSFNEMEQEILDKFILSGKADEGANENFQADLIKGLNTQTYDRIWSYIINWDGGLFTAEELAEKLGMARVTVRRYLEYMQKEGKLDIEIGYGRVGRPQHRYKVK